MKIVILNDSFFGERHLNELRSVGELVVFDGTETTEDAIARTGDADIVLADGFLSNFNKKYFDAVPNLRLLVLNSTAFEMVDYVAAAQRGIKVANVPGFSKRSVAELIIGLMFAVVRRIPYGDRRYRAGFFDQDPASPEGRDLIAYDLQGKTMGILGLGRIGTEVALLGSSIGMNVIGWSRKKCDGVTPAELEDIFEQADIIVLTLAFSEELRGIVSKTLLSKMKRSAVFISVGRKDFVDMGSLYELLKNKEIMGAAFDFAQCKEKDPMLALDNVVFTPHVGSYTVESFEQNLPNIIVENVRSFLSEEPKNIVN
jgi:D-3-phosphoglycerate dehydrogenase